MLKPAKMRSRMKTFAEYVSVREMASYDQDPKAKAEQSNQAVEVAMKAVKKILGSKPEILISFLNLQRTDPAVKEVLDEFGLDAFPNVKDKLNMSYDDEGLGYRNGEEEALHPNAADGYHV
jgi:hypothetical protein